MKTYNILVTGVGAVIGYGAVNALRRSKFSVNISGMDIFADAVGRQWCDQFVLGVKASDDRYCDFLAETIDSLNIDLVLFGLESEIFKIYDQRHGYKADFSKLMLNEYALTDLSRDKWIFNNYLARNGFATIKTMIEGSYAEVQTALGKTFLVKPRSSSASKGISLIESEADYLYWQYKLGDNFMVQEIVGDEDHEFTVGAFGLGDGQLAQTIAFQRRLNREGSTSKAKTVSLPKLEYEVGRLAEIFKPVGPTNFQFRQHQDDFLLLEINPRMSSSLSIRVEFGFNEPEMCIEYFLEHKVPAHSRLSNGSAVRYFSDYVVRS